MKTHDQQQMKHWLRHRHVLQALLKHVGDEHLEFKPWAGAMPLGKLALHVAHWGDAFVSMVKDGDGKFGEYIASEPKIAEHNTLDKVRLTVNDLTEKTKAAYEALTVRELETENESAHSEFQGPRRLFLSFMYDHEVHHKGQLFVYVRMTGGKDLPFFR